MKIAIGGDHAGFEYKAELIRYLAGEGFEMKDFGPLSAESCDYPDFAQAVAEAVRDKKAEVGIIVCGSGVGASIAANKVPGVLAGLIHDVFSAHQGVEDDDMNVFCLGGKVIGSALALELIEAFLTARFSGAARHRRRLAKVRALELEHATIVP